MDGLSRLTEEEVFVNAHRINMQHLKLQVATFEWLASENTDQRRARFLFPWQRGDGGAGRELHGERSGATLPLKRPSDA